jgi:hypothetical protein
VLIARRNGPAFPSEKVFRRFGSKGQRIARVIAYCEATPDLADVAALWRKIPTESEEASESEARKLHSDLFTSLSLDAFTKLEKQTLLVGASESLQFNFPRKLQQFT